MNTKAKNNILLTAAILSIIVGAAVTIAVIYDFAYWGLFEYGTQALNPLFLAGGIVLIVFGARLCKAENRAKNSQIIAAISTVGALLLCVILYMAIGGEDMPWYIAELLLAIATLVLLIVGLVLKGDLSPNTTSKNTSENKLEK